MTTKNLGTAVSAYLNPEGRAWETVGFQTGKPVLDRELNLSQDVDAGFAQSALMRAIPSGWLSSDFTASSDHAAAIFTDCPAANVLEGPALTAHVNGWIVPVRNTGVGTGLNQVTLPAAPSGTGVKRTDVVILEVWRKLISAQPSTDGKSQGARIWKDGNVKIPVGSDGSLNFVDDLYDTNVASETTKRVQIQYRLRVASGIDIFSFPEGLDDPTLVANSVPANANAPDGVATAFNYTNQSPNGDAGLWLAGDGNPTNTLGTVDGYIYAIPLMAVFRRNSTVFDRNTNQNGAGPLAGTSGRPDGLFYDSIVAEDIADLRHGVDPNGWDLEEVLDKTTNLVLDNTLRTEWATTAIGGGVSGHTFLWADEIGVSNGNGGDGVTTGDTPGAEFIGQFDNCRRDFSDRAVVETVTVTYSAPGGGWNAGSTVTISPTSLPVYPYTAFNWAAYNDATSMFIDVKAVWMVGAAGEKSLDVTSYLASVTNLGVQPVTSVGLTFQTAFGSLGLSNEDIYIELVVAYPPGSGLSKTPVEDFGTASITVNNPGQLPATTPFYFSTVSAQSGFDWPHREARLLYETLDITYGPVVSDSVLTGKATFQLPERALSFTSAQKNGTPIVGSMTLDTTGRILTFTNSADYTSPGDTVSVTYKALRPLPQNGEQLTLWYNARAPQTIRSVFLGTSLQVVPRRVMEHIYTLSVGSGSPDEAYPFPYQYVQTGGVYPSSSSSFAGEHEFDALGDIAVTDFNALTGLLQVPVRIPFVSNPESLILQRSTGDVDIEGRSFFKSVPSGYSPNAYAPSLSDPKRHKVVLPLLVELPADGTVGNKGLLCLMLLVRMADFDDKNYVSFNSDLTHNRTSASIFRVKGNLLVRRS